MSKVVHLTTVHPPFDIRIFYKEIKTLVREGHDVTLIARYDKDAVVAGVRIVALPEKGNRFMRMFGLPQQVLRLALREQATIYHFHDPELIPVGVALKLSGKRVVYDVHEDLPKQIFNKGWIPAPLRGLVAGVARVVETLASWVFDGVVTATPSIARRFPAAKTETIYNFPITDEFAGNDSAPYHSRSARVIYVGGISVIRGIREMIRAMSLMPTSLDPRLILVGAFSPPSLEEEVRSLPGWERVDFLGWQERASVVRLFGEARIGLLILHPTRNHLEGWPTKLFEYMSAGLPVIASDFPLWRGIIETEGCGLVVNPLDPGSIAEAMEYLLTHPKEAEEMGKRGRRAVLERYNWDTEGEKLLSLYRRLASNGA